ncbi:hypothetical protein [Agromyces humi]|uniref:hypothetical protein n=1 Tax=Agromyces humi TaxID=1766800 RepID=UPI0013595153|nr:hypothetical protein [Agromyces humi]
MTGMLGRDPRRPFEGGCGNGCCNTKADHRKAKKAVKQAEAREVAATIAEETGPSDFDCGWDDARSGHLPSPTGTKEYKAGYCEFLAASGTDKYCPEYYAPEGPYRTETPR